MRVSLDEIKARREKRQTVFLVTGATGFLGSHKTIELLKKGYKLILIVRPNNRCSARERLTSVFEWFNISLDSFEDSVSIIEGELEKPGFGIDRRSWSNLVSSVDEIIHCAADTSFSEKKRAGLESVNIGILHNLLALIDSPGSRCSFFHHISTVYTAGKRSGSVSETLHNDMMFNNPYEETKWSGEKFLSEKLQNRGVHLNIYRPSIVYGHSVTGRSTVFNAVYYPVRMALFLRDTYLNDIRNKGGDKAAQMGVSMNEDGTVLLPIRMEKIEGGEINLIPIDYYIDAFMAIMENGSAPGIFHIVNKTPNTLDDITDFFCTTFGVTGFHSATKETFRKNPPNAIEILFREYLKMYGPYIRDTRKFENRNTRSILDKFKITCPRFTQEVFSICMNYAVSMKWKSPW